MVSRLFNFLLRSRLKRKKLPVELNRSLIMDKLKSIEEFGYKFNAKGQLRKIGVDGNVTDQPFQFDVSKDHSECQARYEELGEAITSYVYHLLENQEQLIKLPVPIDSDFDNATFIFASKDYDKKDVLMILIHGSGVVRAGQWSRSLIINSSLETGSQISYIKRAKAKNYGVIIMNTNDNYRSDGKEISNSGSAEEHALYVWKTYINHTKASSIAIVAHSYGGAVTMTLADKMKEEFKKRVKAIALTDSVHGYANVQVPDFIKKVSRNWISNSSALDTPLNTPEFDIKRVSAGHPKHEMTSASAIDSVFKFIDDKIND